MTLEDWSKSPDLVAAWALTWEQPHMKLALEIIKNRGLPKATTVLPTGVGLIELNAAKHFTAVGYFEALANIELLKREKAKEAEKTDPNTTDWGDADLTNPPPETRIED